MLTLRPNLCYAAIRNVALYSTLCAHLQALYYLQGKYRVEEGLQRTVIYFLHYQKIMPLRRRLVLGGQL
jgi:hypothetical protein